MLLKPFNLVRGIVFGFIGNLSKFLIIFSSDLQYATYK